MAQTARILGALILGGIGWSFAEYAIHNWVMHKGRGRNEFSRQHLAHHAAPYDQAPIWGVWAVEALVVGALAGLGGWLAGWQLGLAFAVGFTATYHFYERVHTRLHTHPPRGPLGRLLRRHHMIHHFVAPQMNHGVTVPLWDRLFGTKLDVACVPVPRVFAMPWLLDAEGRVRAELRADYVIKEMALPSNERRGVQLYPSPPTST